MKSKYQRDLNRLQDTDKSSRKRGLQKLLDDLPWSTQQASERNELQTITREIIPSLTVLIADSVEKCRELSLTLLSRCIHEGLLSTTEEISLIEPICARLNDLPFPEPSEELRLQCLTLLGEILHRSPAENKHKILLHMLASALADTFPAAKSEAAILFTMIAEISPALISMNHRAILKLLFANALHQHAKAIGLCLSAVTEDYRTVVQEHLQPVLLRLVTDHSAQVRSAVVGMCEAAAVSHAGVSSTDVVAVNIDMTVALLQLRADETQEVRDLSHSALDAVASAWSRATKTAVRLPHEGEDIEDAEEAMRAVGAMQRVPCGGSDDYDDTDRMRRYLVRFAYELTRTFSAGVGGWTSGARVVSLRGLDTCVGLMVDDCALLLPSLLPLIGDCLLDDEQNTRIAAETVCRSFGYLISPEAISDEALVLIDGTRPGLDTASARAVGLRASTHMLVGHVKRIDEKHGDLHAFVALVLSACSRVSDLHLHEFRDHVVREACLLLARLLVDLIQRHDFLSDEQSVEAEFQVASCLILLAGRLLGESVSVVSEIALKELSRLASGRGYKDQSAIIDVHFRRLLTQVTDPLSSGELNLETGVRRAVFEVLVREGGVSPWREHRDTIILFIKMTKPQPRLEQGSPEELAQSYASMRGEDISATSSTVEIRLHALALLEDMIRRGSQVWECGAFITLASESILNDIAIPNLIWRAGRVEAAMRKVALATCYGILKAGATSIDVLLRVAPPIVPLLTSALDDTHSDVSPRCMACYCLTVIFERLKGHFGEQSVREVYPLLLKRLDDSNDDVRTAICSTLTAFFLCAEPEHYRGTPIDYSLDQLFIHLDDSNKCIQDAVFKVIVDAASVIDMALVVRKAESSKTSHRSPHLCDAIISSVMGA